MNTQSQQQQPQDLSALIAGLEYRVRSAETEVTRISQQIQGLVSSRENDLKVQGIKDDMRRIEKDVADTKAEALEAKHQLSELNNQLLKQEQEGQKRDAIQRESQLRLQVNTMKWIGGVIVSILLIVLGAYLTHVLH